MGRARRRHAPAWGRGYDPAMAVRKTRSRYALALRAFGLSYPETHEDFPWGHRALKVWGKVFAVLSEDEPGRLSLSVKLPASAEGALQLPFCEPTHYGLGRSGWVTAKLGPRAAVPLDVLRSWIDESYRAIAPKKLVAALACGSAPRPALSKARAQWVFARARPRASAAAARTAARPAAHPARRRGPRSPAPSP
jgi:predicted DNA-binding protein (MmcQ/YjbR family)